MNRRKTRDSLGRVVRSEGTEEPEENHRRGGRGAEWYQTAWVTS